MHGSVLNPSFSTFNDAQRYSYINSNDDTATRIMELDAKLQMKLGPEYISQRPGPGGGPKLTYIEGWKVINLANEIFGHNGWSSSIVNLTTDYMDSTEGYESGSPTRWNIGVTAIVKVTLRDGVFHEDVGYGTAENQRNKGAALDKAKKEAVTDALKRSLRNFGNVLGNCLYDKKYAQNIVKVKVPEVRETAKMCR
ncbi:Rad52/22 family double-strand break repair protein-domain-containing protein [Flagelloscypha sp. PMI_526]|nr:Rad52/22 family double-strand break repair protein-domain-containing protein [Flagelloscypha sp. PMI_526]